MEKNYKFVIAYDGTRFFGWEHQPDKETIQGKLETVLERLQGHPVDLIGAGRDDRPRLGNRHRDGRVALCQGLRGGREAVLAVRGERRRHAFG